MSRQISTSRTIADDSVGGAGVAKRGSGAGDGATGYPRSANDHAARADVVSWF